MTINWEEIYAAKDPAVSYQFYYMTPWHNFKDTYF